MLITWPVGIDLGTTQSGAAYIDRNGSTQMIRNAEGDILTPSVVLFEKDEIIVGHEARRMVDVSGERVAETAKRDMGQAFYHRAILGKQVPPEAIQGCILRKLYRDIKASLEPEFKAVITVPAYFDEARRKATTDAGKMSGLDVLDIVNEPTAAALAFGELLGYLDPKGSPRISQTMLVYDLGGGTFDVTIIRIEPGDIRTLATDGDANLGGYNWDLEIVNHMMDSFREKFPDSSPADEVTRLHLRQIAEEAKHTLSSRTRATVPININGRSHCIVITREELNNITAKLVDRTAVTTKHVLNASGLLWDDIDRLLLVGGSSRMPMIRDMIENLSGMKADTNVNPDEAVARGAAIFARYLLAQRGIGDYLPELNITDVNAHSLGIEGINQVTRRKENVTLIPRNTPLPKEVHRVFVTKEDDQTSVQVQLLEGESIVPKYCISLAHAAIRNLPHGLPKGTKIDVIYRYETNGRLTVRAGVPGEGKQAQIELERVQGMENATVSKWKNIICRDGGFDLWEDTLQEFSTHAGMDSSDKLASIPGDSDFEEYASGSGTESPDLTAPGSAPQEFVSLKRKKRDRSRYSSEFSLSRTKSRRSDRNRFIFVLGHILAGMLGLAIGYYILCWIRPDANFLELTIPKLSSPPAGSTEP